MGQLLRLQQQLLPRGGHMSSTVAIEMLAQLLLRMQLRLVATAEARAAGATATSVASDAVGILVGNRNARAVLDVHNGTLHWIGREYQEDIIVYYA